MLNKGRKLIALLLMVALVVTYTFGANLSVFAEEGQGEANAKTSTSESADPAPADEEKPAEEPAAPAPEASENDSADESGAIVTEGSEDVDGEAKAEMEDADDDVPAVKAIRPPINRSLNYNNSYTCNPYYSVSQGQVEHWSLDGADGYYVWDESTHTVTNKNTTDNPQTLTIVHQITIPGNQGFSNTESWNITLQTGNKATINYYTINNQRVHSDVEIEPDYRSYTIWGIPERDGYVFLGWALLPPRPGELHVDFTPGQTVDLVPYLAGHWQNKRATLNLYAVWYRADLGPVHGKSETVSFDGEEHILYGITENPDVTEGFAEFDRSSTGGPRPVTTIYYVKADDIFAKGTEVGEYDTEVGYAMVYSWSSNQQGGRPSATGMYVKVVPGTLTIEDTTFEGEVHAKSDTVYYNGNEQVLYGITEDPDVTEGYVQFDAAAGSLYAVKAQDIYAKGTEIGEYTTEVEKALVYTRPNNAGGQWHSTGKYVKVVPGTLTILGQMKFTVENYEGIYDGQPHTITVNTGDLPDGYLLEYSTDGAGEDAKWSKELPTWTNVEYDKTVKPNFLITHKVWVKATCEGYETVIVMGTVKILPRPVVVNVELSNDSRPYTGEPQTYIAEFTFSTEDEVLNATPGFDPGYTAGKHDYWARGTEVGKYDTNVKDDADSYTLGFEAGSVMYDNFDPSYNVTQGWLEIYSEPVTLTYKLNGGNYDGDTSDVIVNAGTGTTVTIMDAPTRKGYEFQYWEGSKYYPGDEYKVMGDHTFTAVWKKAPAGGNDSDSDKNDKKGKDGDGSSTGDEVGLIGIMALLAASMIGLAALSALRRREQQ